jgi:hypothetical protein
VPLSGAGDDMGFTFSDCFAERFFGESGLLENVSFKFLYAPLTQETGHSV